MWRQHPNEPAKLVLLAMARRSAQRSTLFPSGAEFGSVETKHTCRMAWLHRPARLAAP
jgi:hypothetical protein